MKNASQCPHRRVGRYVGYLIMLVAYCSLSVIPDLARGQTKILANEVSFSTQTPPLSAERVSNPNQALLDDNNFATIRSYGGLLGGAGSYAGELELKFGSFPSGQSALPAGTTTYVKLGGGAGDVLKTLLGGSLGKSLANLLGTIVLGNHYFAIEARNGSTVVASNRSDTGFDSDMFRLVVGADGSFYAAVTPNAAYDRVRISDVTAAVILGARNSIDVYHAFYFQDNGSDCGYPTTTAYSGGGISLSVLDLNNQHLERAIDNDSNSYSELKQGSVLNAQVLGTLAQTFYFPTRSEANHTFNIKLAVASAGVLNADLLGNIQVIAYNGTQQVFVRNLNGGLLDGVDLLQLLQNGDPVTLPFGPGVAFDRVEVRLNSTVGLSLVGSAIRIYDVQRYTGEAGCINPAIVVPPATPPMLSQKDCAANLISFANANFATHTVDGNNDTYSTLTTTSGLVLGAGAQEAHVEMGFGNAVAGDTVYIRINFDENQLGALLNGSLGNALGNTVDNVLLGDHYFTVEAKSNGGVVFSRSSNSGFSNTAAGAFGNGFAKIVQDKNGHYYVALRSDASFTSVRITERLSSLVGLGTTESMDVYHACYATGADLCEQSFATYSESAGISLDLLGLGGAGVVDAQQAIDGDSSTSSKISIGAAGIGGAIYQQVNFHGPSAAADHFRVKFTFGGGTVSASIVGSVLVKAFNGANEVFSQNLTDGVISNLDLLNLLNSGQIVSLPFGPGVAFDRVAIGIESLVAANVIANPLEVFSIERFSAACPDPELTWPPGTTPPFTAKDCGTTVTNFAHVNFPLEAVNDDVDFDTYATLSAGTGVAAGLGAYSSHIELKYNTVIPAQEVSYIRVDSENGLFQALLAGSLGESLANLLGSVALGNQYVEIQLKDAKGTQIGATYSSATGLNTEFVKLVKDKDGKFYLAVTADRDYQSVRIAYHSTALVGGSTSSNIQVYGMCRETVFDPCEQATFTSWDGTGIAVDLLDLTKGGVTNPEFAIDANNANFATLNLGVVAAGATVSQTIYFKTKAAATDKLRVRLQLAQAGILNVDLLGGAQVVLYNGENEVYAQPLRAGLLNNLDLLGLFNSGGIQSFVFEPNVICDRVKIELRSTVAVNSSAPIRLYGVSRISDQCPDPDFETPPYRSPVCADVFAGATAVDDIANVFDGDHNSYASIRSGAGVLLGIGNTQGNLQFGYLADAPANRISYIRIAEDGGLLNNLLSGSLGNVVGGVVNGLALGNHYFTVTVKDGGNNNLVTGSSLNGFADADGKIKIVQDKEGRFYIALTADVNYRNVEINTFTQAVVGVTAPDNRLQVYGMCYETNFDGCAEAVTTSWDGTGLQIGLTGVGEYGVTNAQNALPNNNNGDYSEISLGTLSVLGSIQQNIQFNKATSADAIFKVKMAVGTGSLNAGVFQRIHIVGYHQGQQVYVQQLENAVIGNVNLLNLFNNGQAPEIAIQPGVVVDELAIQLNSLADANVVPNVRLYYIIEDCDAPQFRTWKSYMETSSNTAVANVVGGEEIAYTIHIANTGNVALQNYRVIDTIPAYSSYVVGSGGTLAGDSVVFTIPAIAAGDTATVSFNVNIDTDLTGATVISNVAFVKPAINDAGTGTVPPVDPANPTAGPDPTAPAGTPTDIPVSPRATIATWKGFSVSGGVSTTEVQGGESVAYTIYTTNTGNQALSGVSISDALPVGTTYVSGGTFDGTTVTFAGIDIAVGDTVETSFNVTVNSNLTGITAINNVAVVTATGTQTSTSPADPNNPAGGPAQGSNPGDPTVIPVTPTDSVLAWKGYSIANGASTTSVAGGEEITYSIYIQNKSNQDLTDLVLTDALPQGTRFVSAGNGGVNNAGEVTFSNIDVAFGATTSVSFVVKVDSNLTALNAISNVAFVKNNPADPTGTGTVPPADPSNPAGGPDTGVPPGTPTDIPVDAVYTLNLSLTGVSGGSNSGQATAADVITYTVSVKNTGNKNLVDLVLKAGIPVHTQLVDAIDFTLNGDSLARTIATLPVGGTQVFTFTVRVDDPIDINTIPAINNSVTAQNSEVSEVATSSLPTDCIAVDATDIQLSASAKEICLGDAVTLTAMLSGNASTAPDASVKWYGAYNAGAVSEYLGEGLSLPLTPTAVGVKTYYAIIQDAGFCFNNPPAQVSVTVNAVPLTPSITASATTVCAGETITLTATGGVTYSWTKVGDAAPLAGQTSGTLTIANVSLADAGQYTVVAINAAGCAGAPSAAVAVVVRPRAAASDIAVTGNENPVCEGSPVTLRATSTLTNPVFYWYSSETATTAEFTGPVLGITPNSTVTYYVAVAGDATCENDPTDRLAVTVTVNPAPVIRFNEATSYTIEINQSVPLPTYTTEPGVTYQWKDQSGVDFNGTSFGPFASPGTYVYTLIATNTASGCQTAANISIQVFNPGECPPIYERVYAHDASQFGVSRLLFLNLGSVTNAGNAADQDVATFSTLTEGVNALNLLGQTFQHIRFSGSPIPAGTAVTVKLGKNLTVAQLAGGIRVQPIDAAGNAFGASQLVDGDLVNIVAGENIFEYTFVPTATNGQPVEYSGVKVYLTALATVAQSVNVYEAYYQQQGTSDCSEPNGVIDVLSGIERPINGVGVLNGLVSVSNAENAVDGDEASFALLNNLVGVNAFTRLEVIYNTPALAGDTLTIRVSKPSTLLTLGLLESFRIQPYLGNNAVGEPIHNDASLLRLTLLPGNEEADVQFIANAPFDRIKILYGGVASVLDQLRVHNIVRTIPRVVAGPNGDNKFEICPGGDITIPAPDNCTSYLVYDSETGGNVVDVTNLTAGNYTLYVQTVRFGSCEIGERTPIEVTVNETPAAPVVADQTVCETAASVEIAYDVEALPGYTLQYYADATTSTALTTVPTVNSNVVGVNTVFVSQINSAIGCESARVAVTIVVTATPAPILTELTQTFCEIDSATVADLNTTGATGTVVWYSSATGGTALAATTALTSGTYYAAQLIDGCESVARTAVTVSITATPAPTLTELTQTFCESDSATVADLNTTGATGTLVWYSSATGGTALAATTALTSGTYYAAQLVDGCESIARTAVTVSITSTAPPTLTELTQTFCESDSATVADLNTTGATGTIIWYSSATGGTALAATTALTSGTYYAAQLVDGCESVARTEVTVNITATPAPTLTKLTQTFCESDSATVAELNTTGATGTVVWYSSATGGTALAATTALTSGTYYAAQLVDGCESVARTAITVSITATTAPTLTELTQTFCEIDSATVADLITTGATGTVVWYSSATGGTALAATTALTSGTYYAAQLVDGCESIARTAVTVNITATSAPTLTELTQTFCESDSATVADLNTTGATGTVVWYSSATGGTALAATTALTSGTYYAAQLVDGCESAARTAVTVSITSTAPPTIENATPIFCLNDSATLADLAVVGTNIRWYDSPTAGNLLPATTVLQDGATYYASQTVANCESAARLLVTPVVNDCAARLTITKVADDNRVRAGESTSFTLTITNTGPGLIESGDIITLAELPSAGLTITGYAITSGNASIVGSANEADITVNQTVAVGEVITVRVIATVSADAPSTVKNGVKVWGPDKPETEDPDDEDETPEIPVDRDSRLQITKVADQARVQAGSNTSFTVTITNAGPAAIATGRTIQLAELPSEGLTITGYEVTSGNGTIIGNATRATVTTTSIVAVGGTIVVKLTAAVATNAPETISNGIRVWGPDKPDTEDPDDEDETPEIPVDRVSVLRIEKMADDASVRPEEQTSFTLTITNDGPAEIATGKQINLTERPGAGLTIETYSIMGTNATITGTDNKAVITTLATIPVGGNIIVKVTALVDEDAPDFINNGVTVWGPEKPDTEDPDDEDDIDPIPVDHPRLQAVHDTTETKTGVPVTIDVLENDIEVKWEIDRSTVEIVSFTPGSTVVLLGNGHVSYTSPLGFSEEDIFVYRVKDSRGRWSNHANVHVNVIADPLFIPNVITPNGDGLNDRLVILGTDTFDRIAITVINRWGNEVYQNDNYKGEWDGRGLNDGTYFIFVKAIRGGNSTDVKSTVLIKRN
ncbi:gliding motility-associated C-terminal domain-containing protein [Sphingobacterium oryzagri]|uniref:Gliding motility-associated C-terminal domain-containing protein n=1 Tax=Sphingobacterium oryzagri TaxID=3025669 RepID=A0ABY7WK02_9SPHI|nr:gliding motility-associated C-terminal domain-containing protein [Sphingobacterium sp. KACC 22765]WDF67709.1 gliding motility-associated C-terminal domain-containing protein [Sphingobacterium sp. KACC 22765]